MLELNLEQLQRRTKEGGDVALGNFRRFELRPVAGSGDDPQVSLRPFIGQDAGITQGHGVVLHAPDDQPRSFNLSQLAGQ